MHFIEAHVYEELIQRRDEAHRRNVQFDLDLMGSPRVVHANAAKIRILISNLAANAGMTSLNWRTGRSED